MLILEILGNGQPSLLHHIGIRWYERSCRVDWCQSWIPWPWKPIVRHIIYADILRSNENMIILEIFGNGRPSLLCHIDARWY